MENKAEAKDRIDYDFISKLEGGCKTMGYIPSAADSNSGVTIATGFDLGQKNEFDLKNLGINKKLIEKLKPYLGKKKDNAITYLKKNPLKIILFEAESIDKATYKKHIGGLVIKYKNSTFNKKKMDFFALPGGAQTVIASVSYQYGVNLDIRTPAFWKAVTSQNWQKTNNILNDFKDIYPTRRKKEAVFLKNLPENQEKKK